MHGQELHDPIRRVRAPLCGPQGDARTAFAFLDPGAAERALVQEHRALLESLAHERAG